MQVVLHPRVAPKTAVRVWLGVRPVRQAPALRWKLDQNEVVPTAIRPLSSARGADLLAGNPARVFTGIYEFANLTADRAYRIDVLAEGVGSHSIQMRTLPDGLPGGTDSWLNILLVSCYHYDTSSKLALQAVVSEISKACRPTLSLLLGDQVYLDLPTLKDLPTPRDQLAPIFERDYARNWFDEGEYREVLAAAPSACVADDHEYWNNFPHASPWIQNSWSAIGRAEWTRSARVLYEAFQAAQPSAPADELVIDLPPASIFVAVPNHGPGRVGATWRLGGPAERQERDRHLRDRPVDLR
jgi:phosphodiesterase/alkaline phosphatase D-like protein